MRYINTSFHLPSNTKEAVRLEAKRTGVNLTRTYDRLLRKALGLDPNEHTDSELFVEEHNE